MRSGPDRAEVAAASITAAAAAAAEVEPFCFLSHTHRQKKEIEPNFVPACRHRSGPGLQEADNRASSKPESTVSGRLALPVSAGCTDDGSGRERETERWGRERERASGRCPIHPTEDTLLQLNGSFGSCRPGMLMCHRS